MRQLTTSGVRKIDHGGDDIRRWDEPGRALEDFRPDEIDEAESGEPMSEEDDLRISAFRGASNLETKILHEESGNAERDRH